MIFSSDFAEIFKIFEFLQKELNIYLGKKRLRQSSDDLFIVFS